MIQTINHVLRASYPSKSFSMKPIWTTTYAPSRQVEPPTAAAIPLRIQVNSRRRAGTEWRSPQKRHADDGADSEQSDAGDPHCHRLHRIEAAQNQRGRSGHSMHHPDRNGAHRQRADVRMPMQRVAVLAFAGVAVRMHMRRAALMGMDVKMDPLAPHTGGAEHQRPARSA